LSLKDIEGLSPIKLAVAGGWKEIQSMLVRKTLLASQSVLLVVWKLRHRHSSSPTHGSFGSLSCPHGDASRVAAVRSSWNTFAPSSSTGMHPWQDFYASVHAVCHRVMQASSPLWIATGLSRDRMEKYWKSVSTGLLEKRVAPSSLPLIQQRRLGVRRRV
jgi:hypothetical protein